MEQMTQDKALSPPGDTPDTRLAIGKDREVRFLGDLQRLEVKPGDRFVLTVPGPASMDTVDRLRACWKAFIGGDAEPLHELLVLEQGMTIGVINVPEAGD